MPSLNNSAVICCEVMAKVIENLKNQGKIKREKNIIILDYLTDYESFLANLELVLDNQGGKFKNIKIVMDLTEAKLDRILNKFNVEKLSLGYYLELWLGSQDELSQALKDSNYIEASKGDKENTLRHENLELKNIVWELMKLTQNMGLALNESNKQQELILAQNKHQEGIQRQINHISKIATSSLNIDEFYSAFVGEIKKIIDCDRISIATFDETGNNLFIFALAQDQDSALSKGKIIPAMGTALEWVKKTGNFSLASDLKKERFFTEEEALAEEGFRSALRVPMWSKGKIFGTINLNGYKPNNFTNREVEIMQMVAAQVATAIDNAWLFAEKGRQNLEIAERSRRLAILNDISRVVSQSLDLKEFLDAALGKVLEFTDRSCGSIYLIEEDFHQLKMYAHKNLPQIIIEQGQIIPLEQGQIGEAIKSGEPLVVDKIQAEEHSEFCSAAGVKSVAYIPLKAKNRSLGIMLMGHSLAGKISREDLDMLVAIGNQMGIAIENARLYQKIKQLAEYDDLTGLFNRRMFYHYIRKELKRSVRYQKGLALLMIDVDRFKDYNDTYGHLAGDQALAKLGNVLREAVRESDIPARYGGEEFAVLVLEADKEKAMEIAQRIQKRVSEQTLKCPFPTLSIGIATYPEEGDSVEQLIFRADLGLYKAKKNGRNRVILFKDYK